MRRITTGFAALAATTLILSGCATTGQVNTAPRTVKLDDGTEVTCVLAIDQNNGGSASPSCNWERYNQLHPVSDTATPSRRPDF
ncbi:hypothetical protein ACT17_32570 [Mycolicibacterium conceptionense]|uniref:Lipoprotein n=1 Tax=Mycolicibacterium conceptionense TaxID=451644 RepID=A0A0J8TWZ2_9MYCO|nr:hypothetical protein [Mycolicibacterium conceptionense]KMV13918.1 hypothetical protein ACT17_32570 [Mycolicibacterium conceptionense]